MEINKTNITNEMGSSTISVYIEYQYKIYK